MNNRTLKIYLARHGQNVDNVNGILNGHRDEPLTELGEEQARITLSHIKESEILFDRIYSSPLIRAYRTAEIISDGLNLNKPEVLKDLVERDFGVMTGKQTSGIEELCSPRIIKTNTITYFLDPEGAETFPDLINRANNLLNFIKQKHTSDSILLVTHGDIGKMIYCAYYKLNWEDVLKSFHFGNAELILLSDDIKPNESHVFKQNQHNH